jgi:ribosomal protein L39E
LNIYRRQHTKKQTEGAHGFAFVFVFAASSTALNTARCSSENLCGNAKVSSQVGRRYWRHTNADIPHRFQPLSTFGIVNIRCLLQQKFASLSRTNRAPAWQPVRHAVGCRSHRTPTLQSVVRRTSSTGPWPAASMPAASKAALSCSSIASVRSCFCSPRNETTAISRPSRVHAAGR